MNLRKVLLITFSPTHTSRKIGEAILRGLDRFNTEIIDLTLATDIPIIQATKDTLVIFTLPVYGGAVAPLAMQRIANFNAQSALAAAIVVYGNRAYENALNQLEGFATERGCNIIAEGAFVGEHSYSNDKYPIAKGRPDAQDISFAEAFGKEICEKIYKASSVSEIETVSADKISLPEQSSQVMAAFWSEIKGIMSTNPPSTGVCTDKALCNHCGICVENCPTQAITIDDETKTDKDKCIKCCSCVKLCPTSARTIDTPFPPLLSKYFVEDKKNLTVL